MPLCFRAGLSLDELPRSRSLPSPPSRPKQYLQEHAGCGDIVQDSEADPRFALAAICERRPYAIDYEEVRPGLVLSRRLEKMRRFKALTDEPSIRRFAARHGIRWYVLHPETPVRWPATLLARPAFARHGYRVFSFRNGVTSRELDPPRPP